MTTPISNPSEHYKQFRKAVAFAFESYMDTAVLRQVILSTFVLDWCFGIYAMLSAIII